MKVEYRGGGAERALCTAMVVDKAVLAAVSAQWDDKEPSFDSAPINRVAAWAVEHYRKHKKPPQRAVETYFDQWAEGTRDADSVALVAQFLSGLSEEYNRNGHGPSSEFLIDLAAKHFRITKARRLKEKVEDLIEKGDPDKVWKAIHEARPPRVGAKDGVSLLKDRGAVEAAFAARGEDLVRFGQESLDHFFKGALCRDSFIAVQAGEKKKKSFVLQELAWQGLRNRRNVAFFEVGDQSQSQLVLRFGARAASRPVHSKEWPCVVRYPTALRPGSPTEVAAKEYKFAKPLTDRQAWAALRKAGEKYGADRLRLSVHPNSTVSVSGIEAVLEEWSRDGWLPDLCVIDYADILAPLHGGADLTTRDQIFATWKALRSLSQKWHCCVLTATQADAASYNKVTQTRDNFSEDKRKYGQVTGMATINQTPEEDRLGVLRLNWLFLRDLDFDAEQSLYLATCLAFANPFCKSSF